MGNESLTKSKVIGSWCINPQVGICDGNGTGIIAKEGYALAGAREGQLLGRIGSNVFALGNQGETKAG